MKQYLWAGVALLCINAQASENPFELESNFGKLEKEQEVLLSKLKKIAEDKDLVAQEDTKIEPLIEKTMEVEEASVPQITSEERLANMRQSALEASKSEAEERNALLTQAKEAEKNRIAEEQRQLAIAKKEAEALEVEAYEEARAKRVEEEAEEKKAAHKALVEKEKAEAKVETTIATEEDQSTSIDDINITKEKIDEKLKADEEFAAAVKEMGKAE